MKRLHNFARVFVAVIGLVNLANAEPLRIDPGVASKNLVHRVDPTVPAIAKSLQIGGTVVVDITISPEGKISSVHVLSGHPMLVPAFINAVRQWEYKPFSRDGQPISVITRVEWSLPSPKMTASEQTALKDYYPAFDLCYKLVRENKASEAEEECSLAVKLSNELPSSRDLERSSARTFLAHSFFLQHKVNDAIPLYEEAIQYAGGHEGSDHDADFASEHANLARAYVATAQLEKADGEYSRAVEIFKAAIIALPSYKDNYTARLKTTLLQYARLKMARGDAAGAAELKRETEALGPWENQNGPAAKKR